MSNENAGLVSQFAEEDVLENLFLATIGANPLEYRRRSIISEVTVSSPSSISDTDINNRLPSFACLVPTAACVLLLGSRMILLTELVLVLLTLSHDGCSSLSKICACLDEIVTKRWPSKGRMST